MPTPNQVLIVAGESAARMPADVARSLQLTPVIAASVEEAVRLIDQQPFRLVTVVNGANSQRLREAVGLRQPLTRVLELPHNEDDVMVRQLMVRYLEPPHGPARFSSEEQYRFLAHVMESFTGTLDFQEVVRRIVTITREQFHADTAWLLHPVTEQAEFTKVVFSVIAPGTDIEKLEDGAVVPLTGSLPLIRRAMESSRPVVVEEGNADLDPELARRFRVKTEIVQILRTHEGEPWAFGMHQASPRVWSEDEIALFGEIGRYATLALNNSLLHQRAIREMAKINAILNQIPEAAAIYDRNGNLERMNAAASGI